MTPITGTSLSAIDAKDSIEADFWRELAEIEAESIGWQALDDGVYLHVGSDQAVVEITGCATAAMAGCNVLWVV
ncbi:hypothetical protein [Limnohabitans sp.]|uniref:hypothetical protein n=1 Tax=Limnohabitans sp. TaxID=1907725 RepID=UPI002AFF6A61|nr:hypothetical protein [Limnohabitans sp.]